MKDILSQILSDSIRMDLRKRTGHLWCVFCALLIVSCAATQPPKESPREPEYEAEHMPEEPPLKPAGPALEIPDFIPVKEDVSPIQTKTVSISARNTPLRDVLYTIAKTVNLNLVLEIGVEPELPITMTLNSLTVEDALNVIFDSLDYFYSIRDNVLVVRASETRIFEINQPSVIHDYQTDVGGDILGGGSYESGRGTIRGDVSIKSSADKVSFQFWDAVERSVERLLSGPAGNEKLPGTSFTINRLTGTIMVTASKKGLDKVENYIDNLRKALNRQVLIEARIVEVQLAEDLKYGIDWSFIDELQGIGTIDIGTARFSSTVDSTGPSFQINIMGQNFTALLRALETQGDVKTLSNPRINILNGHTALLGVGRNTSFISRVETTTTTAEGAIPTISFTVETQSILSGIIFGLVPYISEEGDITLTITPILSNLVELTPESVGTGDNTIEIQLPTVDLREMSSTVKISDGQMVVIGGLIDKKEQSKEHRVPLLGKMPVIGRLFKTVDESYAKTELVIMLLPKLVHTQ